MIPVRALLVAVPLAAASGWLFARGGARVEALRQELVSVEGQGRDASEAVARLEPGAVEKQLAAYDRRRAVGTELARARRDRVLAVVGIVAAALLFAGLTAFRRVAGELEREQRVAELDPPRRPPRP